MNCEELFRLLPGYLDAEMKRELCCELEEHTQECSFCRAHVHTMRGTIHLARELAAPKAHQEWLDRLRRRVLEKQAGSGEADPAVD